MPRREAALVSARTGTQTCRPLPSRRRIRDIQHTSWLSNAFSLVSLCSLHTSATGRARSSELRMRTGIPRPDDLPSSRATRAADWARSSCAIRTLECGRLVHHQSSGPHQGWSPSPGNMSTRPVESGRPPKRSDDMSTTCRVVLTAVRPCPSFRFGSSCTSMRRAKSSPLPSWRRSSAWSRPRGR